MSLSLIHIYGMFEVVRHNMDRAAAHRYVKMLNDYHMAGFGTVFDPQPGIKQAVPPSGCSLLISQQVSNN